MADRDVHLHRVLRAKPDRVSRAFLDRDAVVKWLPPHGFTCRVETLDAKAGGTFGTVFTNFATGRSQAFGGESLDLVPGARIRHTDRFDDPGMPGVMETTVSLGEVFCGTELTIVQKGVPEPIPLQACYLGGQESLELLAKLVEVSVDIVGQE